MRGQIIERADLGGTLGIGTKTERPNWPGYRVVLVVAHKDWPENGPSLGRATSRLGLFILEQRSAQKADGHP
jgi:hypothetical protein